MSTRIRGVFATDSGMLALWRRDYFAAIKDYDSWARELLEDADIMRHVTAGAVVPINIRSDGVFACDIRAGTSDEPAGITEREAQYLTVKSQPYVFRSTGELLVSEIEHIEHAPSTRVGKLALPSGDYAAVVHLIA